MSAAAEPLEARVARLERELAGVHRRLARLEAEPPTTAQEAEPPAPAAGAAGELAQDGLRGLPALLGRTCLVLGGAFLFRSLTDSGTLSAGVGVALGLAYALVWLALADRASARGRALGGALHALASALIVYPLLFEASTRYALLAPWAAAAALALATAAGLAVAWRRSFHAVAWITLISALLVTTALLFRTRAPLPFVLALLLLAAASLALAYGRGWRGQRWLVALAVDAVVLLLGLLRVLGRAPAEWLGTGPVLVAQVGLVAIYLGAFVLRLLLQGREITGFAVTQTVLALAVGFEGALWIGDDAARRALAVAALAAGVLLHVGLARRSERRFGHGFAVGYFASVATFLAAEGTRVLLPAALYAPLWLLAAVALAALSLDGRRPILQVHAALLTLAGAIASGLAVAALAALASRDLAAWPPLPPAALVVLALALAAAALLYRSATRSGASAAAVAARLATLVVALLGLGGVVARFAAGALAEAPGADARAGTVAAVRSAVLALAAVALAAGAAGLGRAELARAAFAVLVVGGAKLVVEDLRVEGATHLVFSLALYGGALVAVPALVRRARPPAADEPPPARS
ncbi:MAG: hypothetical protein H6Q03_1314 [Acidobacteria bacterium]|nr:hypothetical protein [Acidobacteriota bacterium]